MSLEADIDGWTAEDDKKIEKLIESTAKKKNIKLEEFPSKVIVTGNNWCYVANLYYNDKKGLLHLHKLKFNCEFVTVTPDYTPLTEMLDMCEKHLVDGTALLPISEKKNDEAHNLGKTSSYTGNSYDVNYNGINLKVISVNK